MFSRSAAAKREVSHAHTATSDCPPAAPVGTCQGISHFISFFVARLSFVMPLKGASKAIAAACSLHLDTAYSVDFLKNQWLGKYFFFPPKLQIQDVSLSLTTAQAAHLMLAVRLFSLLHIFFASI